MKFKIGDRVIVSNKGTEESAWDKECDFYLGEIGTIVDIDSDTYGYGIKFDKKVSSPRFYEEEISLYEEFPLKIEIESNLYTVNLSEEDYLKVISGVKPILKL